jgi:hypothetical protein
LGWPSLFEISTMIEIDFDAVERRIRLIGSDSVLAASFAAQHPTLITAMSDLLAAAPVASVPAFNRAACPAIEDIAALQCTVFDNWKLIERGNRWGGNVKVYISAPVKDWKKPAWSANVALWPIADAVKKAKALQSPKLKNPISDATVDLVKQAVDTHGTDFVGILCHKHPADGTFFYDQHLVGINVQGARVTGGFVYTPECGLSLPPFVSTDARGDALSGKAVAMSRYSDLDAMSDWATLSEAICIK